MGLQIPIFHLLRAGGKPVCVTAGRSTLCDNQRTRRTRRVRILNRLEEKTRGGPRKHGYSARGVEPRKSYRGVLRDAFFSFSIAFLRLSSLAVSSALRSWLYAIFL